MREGEFVLIWLQHCFILVWNLSGLLKRNTKMEIFGVACSCADTDTTSALKGRTILC